MILRMLWCSARYDIVYALVQTRDGGYALAGLTYSFSTGGGQDFWLIKLVGLPVGGEWAPIDKLQTLVPLITMASLVIAASASFAYARLRRKQYY